VVVAVLGGVVVTLGATLLFGCWGATAAVVVVGTCWVVCWLDRGSIVLAGTGFGHSAIVPMMAAMASNPPTPISRPTRRRGGGSTGGRS
jgi:hypothetical protein